MKRTLIFFGEGPPEIIIKKRFETKSDYIRRSVVVTWLSMTQLIEAGSLPCNIEIAGYLKKPIMAKLERIIKWIVEKEATGELNKLITSKTHSELKHADDIISQILTE